MCNSSPHSKSMFLKSILIVNKTFRWVSVPCNSVYTQNLNYSQVNIGHGTFNNFSHTIYCKFAAFVIDARWRLNPSKDTGCDDLFFLFLAELIMRLTNLWLSNKVFLIRKLKVTDELKDAMPIWSNYGFSWRNKSNVK